MSGGERTWIEMSLTRAIAVYLAQHSGRRYTTLFSDEADGALDPERKRMFMAMKREVLRLGGYEREFFISQTPELTAMADAVIDLDALHADCGGAGAVGGAVTKPLPACIEQSGPLGGRRNAAHSYLGVATNADKWRSHAGGQRQLCGLDRSATVGHRIHEPGQVRSYATIGYLGRPQKPKPRTLHQSTTSSARRCVRRRPVLGLSTLGVPAGADLPYRPLSGATAGARPHRREIKPEA